MWWLSASTGGEVMWIPNMSINVQLTMERCSHFCLAIETQYIKKSYDYWKNPRSFGVFNPKLCWQKQFEKQQITYVTIKRFPIEQKLFLKQHKSPFLGM